MKWLIVFDLDGTLVDTAPDLLDSLNHSLAASELAAVDEAGVEGERTAGDGEIEVLAGDDSAALDLLRHRDLAVDRHGVVDDGDPRRLPLDQRDAGDERRLEPIPLKPPAAAPPPLTRTA